MTRTLAAVFALAVAATAQAPTVTTVLNNGPTSTHYDLVILGDGYQAAEQGQFDQDVTTFLAGLFQKAPYSMLSGHFNVHTVFRASQDSGASHPDANPPIARTTAYGASYNTGGTARCLYITNTSLALADAALAPANETRVLVMVNDARYGGCAGTFAVSYNGGSMVEVQSHEMGHAAAQLADEYDYPNGNYTGSEPTRVNITANALGQKWSHWWGVENVGAFQGAGYYLTGLWRPKNDCLMRNLGVILCPICREQITRAINAVVDTIQTPQPATAAVTIVRPTPQTFSFTSLVPAGNPSTITWQIDGNAIAGQTGTSLTVDPNTLALGIHVLTVQVRDNTPVVRVDPSQTMTDSHAWTLTVTDPSAANLRLIGQTVTPTLVPVGAETDLAVTVVNDGPAAATNVTVEHFLSTDAAVQTTDVYLGGTTIAALGAGQQQQIVRRVRVPAWLGVGGHLVLGSVDRGNAIVETSETDNLAYTTLLAQTGACPPVLDYRDDLLYPRDRGGIPIATGGSLRPTVAARCAAPGSLYVIVWGCSGTAPGIALAPGLIAPLNPDSCTLLVLDNLNGSAFQSFFGPLDAQGIGRAVLTVPPGLSLTATPGHLVGVILDPALQFTAVTNALPFDLQ